MTADQIFHGGRLRVSSGASISNEGLLVRNGRIAAIGRREQLDAMAEPGAELIETSGLVIVPGLIDAHCHLSAVAYLMDAARCGPDQAPDLPSLLGLLREASPRADGWVTAYGLQERRLAEGRYPTRWELDAVVDGPCVVYQTSLHSCVVNSQGLEMLGLATAASDPPGGVLGRNAAGEPNGVLFEQPMFDLFAANQRMLFSQSTADESRTLIENAALYFAGHGITGLTEAGVDAPTYLAFRDAAVAGRLPIRVRMLWATSDLNWPEEAESDALPESLAAGGVKLFADGGMTSRTAAVDEPYSNPPHERGLLLLSADELTRIVRRYDSAGFQVAVHAQGERAIRSVISAMGRVASEENPLRHRIEHGGAFRHDLREAAAALRLAVVSQPGFIPRLGVTFRESFGPERSEYLYPFRSLINAGIRVAASSDAPVIDASPLVGMYGSVRRQTVDGGVLADTEAVAPVDALRMYTEHAAWVSHLEGEAGVLEAGRDASFTALTGDPLHPPDGDHRGLSVALTVARGVRVHDSRSDLRTQ